MALLLLIIAGGFGFGRDLYLTARDLVVLRAERKEFSGEVERLKTELAVERAKRIELERQAAELNAKVAELNGQVEFLRVRRAPLQNLE